MNSQKFCKPHRSESTLQSYFCFRNFKKYLNETTLHGLRFVGDDNLTIWERFFFLCAFIAAVITTAHLIISIYAKWDSTPVIIGVDPYPEEISGIPFPAIVICNTNQLLRSKISKYNVTSPERAMIDMACFKQPFNKAEDMPDYYKHNNLSFREFIAEHSQPCSRLIKACFFGYLKRNCSDLFRESITDDGLCCVFNTLHPRFRFKKDQKTTGEFTNTDGSVPVSWTPEAGYQKNLPKSYYPRTASGIGVSMGLSVVLDAELNEYFCSSTNGAGFKIALQSPIESPSVREIGFVVGIGEESRLRIDASSSSSARSIRSLPPKSRQCYFGDEGGLIFYKHYTRRNCEKECQSRYIYDACRCTPYNLPRIIPNNMRCGAPHSFCVNSAQNSWLRTKNVTCRDNCYSSCFDLTFTAKSFSAPLARGAYLLQDERILKNMSRQYVQQNIAIVHFYYREFIFHGTLRNVYIGFTDFLSNSGGILGLFLGFSFISLAEAFYYAFIRPIFWWKRPACSKVAVEKLTTNNARKKKVTANSDANWMAQEVHRPRREYGISRKSPFTGMDFKSKKNVFALQKSPRN